MKRNQWIIGMMVLGAVGLAGAACGQAGMAGNAPTTAPVIETTRRISITPITPSIPALKYRLTWAYADQVAGNGATTFLIASGLVNEGGQQLDKDYDRIEEMLDMPLEKVNLAEAEKCLSTYQMILDQLEQGSICETCDWSLPLRQQGYRVMVPHMNNMRIMAKFMALNVRIHLIKGDMEGAIKWLRVGYVRCIQLGRQAPLIQGLVATGMISVMNQEAMDLILSDKGPNLYWALTNLPKPMLDYSEMMEIERGMTAVTFPMIRDIKTRPITAESWRDFGKSMQEWGVLAGSKSPIFSTGGMLDETLSIALSGVMIYPMAREYLKNHGYDDRLLDTMTAPQILMHYMVDSYDEASDETMKLIGLPYWEAIPAMMEKEMAIKAKPSTMFLTQLTGAFSKAIERFGEEQRQIELMRTIEAIRAYAAGHEGKLPEKLADMTETPPGIDPFTGKVFEWKVEGGKGILSKAKVEWQVRDKIERYEITVRK